MSRAESAHSWEFTVLLGAARVLAPATIVAVFGLLVAGVFPVSLWTWVVTGVIFAAFYALVWGATRREREAGDELTLALGAICLLLSLSLFYYLGCRWVATSWSYGYTPVLLLLVAVMVGFALVLGLPRLRRIIMGDTRQESLELTGVLGPFAPLSTLFVFMTSVFASITLIAADQDFITLTAAGRAQPSFEEIAQLYIWQFCKSVPLLDINETLRWNVPFVYVGTGTELLVLLYKFAVIIPVIGTFLFFWKQQTE